MSKSYLLQGFNAARKTVNKKKSNIILFIFSSVASTLGKFSIIFTPFFQMYELNISKNAVLYNEIDMIQGVKEIDDIKANTSLHLVNVIKTVLLISLGLVVSLFLGLVVALGSILGDLSELNIFVVVLGIPIIIIGIAIMLTINAFFTPSSYIALRSNDKSLYAMLNVCKNSLRISTLVKIVLYNLLYLLIIIGIPVVCLFLCINIEQSMFTIILLIIGILLYTFVFSFLKLVKDSSIYILISNNVNFDNKEIKKYVKSDEEELSGLFNK